jgi:hypothetical protein
VSPIYNLEGVVLGRNLLLEERRQGSLHHDVVTDLGDLSEEEEGEETSDTAEAASKDTTISCQRQVPVSYLDGAVERNGAGRTPS